LSCPASCGRPHTDISLAGPPSLFLRLLLSSRTPAAAARSGDGVLAPPLCRIYGRSAVRPPPPNAPAPPSLRIFALRASRILSWWLRGLGRPTPFFHDHTNAPLSVPRVLTASERAAFLNSA